MWKLVGGASGYLVTLFKSAEREDVEAQFQRLTREGYYKDLQILDINAVIKQPPPPKLSPAEKKKQRSPDPAPATKPSRAKVAAYKPVIAQPRVRSASAKAKATTAAKSTKKTASKKKSTKKAAKKSTAKKASGSASATKKAARKTIKKKK